ncbi:MAG: diacylglycerol kinase family protein [Pseudomonadota bacterium]
MTNHAAAPFRPRNALALVNPISGRGRGEHCLKQLPDLFKRRGVMAEVIPLTGPEALAATIQAEAAKFDLVAVGGGDGTINRAAQAILKYHPDKPLGLIPLGLSNCLARHLGLGFDLEAAVGILARGDLIKLDVGLFSDQVFLSFLGAGFDAAVVEKVAGARRGTVSNLDYLKAGWREFAEGPWPELRVEVDGRKVEGVFFQVILTGVSNYARFFSAPKSPGFNLYLFRRAGRWGLPRSLAKLGAAGLKLHRACDYSLKVRDKLIVFSENGEGLFQYDGEKGGRLPLECRIKPKGLTFVGPPS